ncbi:MAG: hypothetical protein WA609_10295 [Terriglobales bacterium]
MDPLITNGIDPGLSRVIEKRGQERDREAPRKRSPSPKPAVKEIKNDDDTEPDPDAPKHEFDDLA